MCVADPRPGLDGAKGDEWFGGGHFGVLPWRAPSGAVAAAAGYDNGHWSVADPRLPEQSDRLVAIIRALDGTWHRPFMTLELASLQSLVDPEEHLELEGLSDAGWRERIGNAVPLDATQAIAETMGRTLLMARSGTGFMLSNPADLGIAHGSRSQCPAARRSAGKVGSNAVTVFCTYCGMRFPS